MKIWMAVYTKPRHEKMTYKYLCEKKIKTYLPLIKMKRKWSDRYQWIEKPMFTSYIFVYAEKNESLNISNNEIDDKIEEMISQNKGSEKKITAFYKQSKNKQQLFNEMLNEKLFEKLSEYAKVKVVEQSTNELRKKQAA